MPLVFTTPTALYLANTTSTGLQSPVLDATDAITAGLPMPFQVVISATATVQILAALELNPSTGALIDPQDVSGGGFTTSNFYDLILSLPFYQVNVTANTGTVKVKVGRGTTAPGTVAKLHLVSATNAATQGL